MSRILTIALFSLLATTMFAQNVKIIGSVKERIDKFDKKGNIKENDFDVRDIANVKVSITSGGKTVTSTSTDEKGNYSIQFNGAGKVYLLEFQKLGYIPKISEMDLRSLTLDERLVLEDWSFGLRKDLSNLSSESIVMKPFERYYYESKKGQLTYDDKYALAYQDEYTETVVVQVEEEHKEDLQEQANLEKQAEKGRQMVAEAQKKAQLLLLQAENRGEQLAHAIQNQARINANNYILSAKNKTITTNQETTAVARLDRKSVYKQIKDSLLQLASQRETRVTKSNNLIATDKEIESRKIQVFAKRQQLEIDRLKAITKEDSLIIQLREQEINSAELEIQKAEGEILNAKSEVERKQQELQLKEAENQNQKNILIIVSLLTLLIVAVAALIYNSNKKNWKIAKILRDQNDVIAKKNDSILASIKYAKRIQDAILPHKPLWEAQLPNSFVLHMPKDIVSGDFYWMHPFSKDETIIAAVDCTGHGVPGAFMSIVGYHSLHMAVNEVGLSQPAAILDEMNNSVNEILRQGFGDKGIKDGMDVSLCLLNTKTNTLQYAGAYNPLWILRNGEIIEIKANKQAVGMFMGKTIPFTHHEMQLQKDDIFFIFSDGYADQFGGKEGKKIMSKGLKVLLQEFGEMKLSAQKVQLKKYLYDWMNEAEEDQVDDICIIGIKIT